MIELSLVDILCIFLSAQAGRAPPLPPPPQIEADKQGDSVPNTGVYLGCCCPTSDNGDRRCSILKVGSADHPSPLHPPVLHQCLLTMMYWIQCCAGCHQPFDTCRSDDLQRPGPSEGFDVPGLIKKLSPVSPHTSPGNTLSSPLYGKMSHFPANVSNSNHSVTLKCFPARELLCSLEAGDASLVK